MTGPDGEPIASDRFLVNSAGNSLTKPYTYFHERYPEAGTSRPIRSTVASCRDEVDSSTSRLAVDLLDHSDAIDNAK